MNKAFCRWTRPLTAALLIAAISAPCSTFTVQAQGERGYSMDNRRRTLSGTATESADNNRFEMRLENGNVITVIARQSEQARKVNRGDRITVAGRYRNDNTFDAEDLNFENGSGDNSSENRRTLEGIVQETADSNRFQIRTERNRIITIIAEQEEQARKVKRGDRITAAGYYRSIDVFEAEDLNINANDNDDQDDRRRTLNGTVTDDADGNQFQMRMRRGRTIAVTARQTDQVRRLKRGDRVTIAGYYRGRDNFDAEDLNINSDNNDNYDENSDNRQTLSGTALGSATDNRFEMRTNSGRILTVTARQSKQAQKVRRGDRVTVAGYYEGRDSFDAEDLNIDSN